MFYTVEQLILHASGRGCTLKSRHSWIWSDHKRICAFFGKETENGCLGSLLFDMWKIYQIGSEISVPRGNLINYKRIKSDLDFYFVPGLLNSRCRKLRFLFMTRWQLPVNHINYKETSRTLYTCESLQRFQHLPRVLEKNTDGNFPFVFALHLLSV